MRDNADDDGGLCNIPYNSDKNSMLSSDDENMNIYSDVNVDIMDTPENDKTNPKKLIKKSKSIENAYSRGNRKLVSNNNDISQTKF